MNEEEQVKKLPERINIRPLEPPKDKPDIRYIACETAFMGRPMEHFMEGREVFADLMTNYYLRYEPESCFVAEDKGKSKVVGYLLGTKDTNRERRISHLFIYPQVALKLLTFQYSLGRKTFHHALRALRSYIVDQNLKPPVDKYPAHLHINLLAKYRRMGIGTQLMDAFIRYLISNKIKGVHLITTSNNSGAISFYEKYGFNIHRRVKTSLWETLIDEKVENLIFTLHLPLEEEA